MPADVEAAAELEVAASHAEVDDVRRDSQLHAFKEASDANGSLRQAYVDWQQDVDAVIAQLRRRALGENVLPAMRTERRNS